MGPEAGVPRAPYQSAAPLIAPEVRRSVSGELRTTMRVRYAYKDIGGYRLHLRSYEGSIPGPTIRVHAGDVLRIRLINDLPPNQDPVPVDMMLPHHFNTTNFHFHGLHVSPEGLSDNIFRSMAPGQSYEIDVIDVLSDLFILRGVPGPLRLDRRPQTRPRRRQAWEASVEVNPLALSSRAYACSVAAQTYLNRASKNDLSCCRSLSRKSVPEIGRGLVRASCLITPARSRGELAPALPIA